MIYNTSTTRLLLWRKSRLPSTAASTAAALICLLSSSFAHDKRVIYSETDTLGCFLAAYQQQSLSSSFRSLSGLMRDGQWNSMAVIATLACSLILSMTTQLSLFPTNSRSGPQQCWSHTHQQCHIFAGFFIHFQWDLCVFGASDVSATSVNIYGFVLRSQEPCSSHCPSCQCMYPSSKDKKCAFISSQTLSHTLSGILMVSMNNILQVSYRSSSALPRRKLSNSRQVIPLCS